jgi:hypothetical protein
MSSTWFVTGASRGFGRELTEQLLARGDRVAATLRKPEQLADLAAAHGDRLWVRALDVTDTAQLRAMVDAAFTELAAGAGARGVRKQPGHPAWRYATGGHAGRSSEGGRRDDRRRRGQGCRITRQNEQRTTLRASAGRPPSTRPRWSAVFSRPRRRLRYRHGPRARLRRPPRPADRRGCRDHRRGRPGLRPLGTRDWRSAGCCRCKATTPRHHRSDAGHRMVQRWMADAAIRRARFDRTAGPPAFVNGAARTHRGGFTADAAFVDGSHRFHEVFVDLYFLRKIVRPGGIIVLDDHWWPAVRTAAHYFETNMGWRVVPGAFDGGTIDQETGRPRAQALRLPNPPFEPAFEQFRPF